MAVLGDLLDGVAVRSVRGDAGVEVSGVVHDSRAAARGSLFCCIPGEHSDGHDFAAAAVGAGSVALLCERGLDLDVTQVVVGSTRAAMGPVASAFWGHPSHTLDVVGVTGTNGKTTTAHLLHAVLTAAGRRAEVIGTLTGTRTTPEGPELQARLAGLRTAGVRAAAMEVSSHALVQHRVDGTWFRVAVFTNLSPEHLDFHPDMEAYFEAKASLFTPERSAAAVLNVDDPYGRRLASSISLPWEPFSLEQVTDVRVDAAGAACRWEGVELRIGLGGRFNLLNALAAAVTARTMGIGPDIVAAGLAGAGPVPGRFETVDAGQPYRVIVDYAHTPDGLEKALTAAREMAAGGRVIVVFGAGGDRDTTKRAAMGTTAWRGADRVVLTSDNPRHEPPEAIIAAVEAGIPDRSAVSVVLDRSCAHPHAHADPGAGDVVLIAGKGH
ncbi:MAG: UDP-N-acetylmuramoyl-L-alanyl-D-glutamate--2,6-diaminopimelate ligase, partial [Acidimicrobiia bacterium]